MYQQFDFEAKKRKYLVLISYSRIRTEKKRLKEPNYDRII